MNDATYDLTCEHDLDGNILAVNGAAARALGIPKERLCTMHLRDILPDDAKPMLKCYLENLGRDKQAEGLMTVQGMGRRRVWQYQNALMIDGDGRTIVRGVARDVTDREEALHRLGATEQQMRCIIENASDVIGIVDARGHFEFHSPSMQRLLGYGAEEIAGGDVFKVIHRDDLALATGYFERQKQAGSQPQAIDFRVRHRDGSWRWFSVVASPLLRPDHENALVINARDITDRVLLESQLEQANRVNSLGKLAATVAHEFNNVLMGIQPFADLMQRPGMNAESVAKAARHIANSVIRGKRVALDILRFTNPAKPSLEAVDVRQWWRQLLPEIHSGNRDDVVLTTSFDGPLVMHADAVQLSQIFTNLLSNARDAMPQGGMIRVSARRGREGETFAFGIVEKADRFVYFRVEDTGIGMSENVLRHAFDPLFTTKQNGGTGLGLPVAHQAVQAHDGYIFAESAVGRGSTFHVFIPATNETVTEERIEPEYQGKPSFERMLIVDDEPAIAEGLAELLRDYGASVEIAGNGAAAILSHGRFRPQLVVIDIRLPDMDGFEVASRLREENAALKILFASGHAASAAMLVEDDQTSFIQKPFDISTLLGAMSSLSGRGA